MFYTPSELSVGISVGTLCWISMLNCGSNVCDNDSTSIFEDCPNNELLELLKTKKHARMFVHMLKYFEHKNHVLHNNLCESNSLIEKYKRRNRILCD